jgi:putative transposase
MSVSEKVKCIEGNDKRLSISRQCELLQLPRSSYYRPRSSLAKGADNQELMRLINDEFLKHPFYGSRKMTAYLNRKGIAVNRKRIQRLMRWMGFWSPLQNVVVIN